MEINNTIHAERPTNYAGFWLRFGAAILDWLIVGISTYIIATIYVLTFGDNRIWEMENGAYVAVPNILNFFLIWLYYALLQSSKYQATLGKQMVGIIVTDEAGGRITFLNATGRYFAKFISAFVLLIGYIMAAFTAKKQALHDIMAGTLVLKKTTVVEESNL